MSNQFNSDLPCFDVHDLRGMVDALHEDGFAVVPGVVDPEVCAEAQGAIDKLEPLHWDHTGITDHYKNVFNRDVFWLQFLDLPGIVDLAETLLGRHCHIIGQTAWRSHPGHRGVGVHADYLATEWPEEFMATDWQIPIFLCTAHIYLNDVDAELCPTRVIRGSHRSGRRPRRHEDSWMGRVPEKVLV